MLKITTKKYSIILSEEETNIFRSALKLCYDIKEALDQDTSKEYEITIDQLSSIKSLLDYSSYIYKLVNKEV